MKTDKPTAIFLNSCVILNISEYFIMYKTENDNMSF